MAPHATLPAGVYRKYKQSTDFFKRWLLRARLAGVGASANDAKTRHPLDVYERVVAAIAREPTLLPPAQLRLWPRAMAACQTAITLRARAALYFPSAANDSHAHFLERLRSWFQTLQDADRPPIPIDKSDEHEKPLNFSNYYEVLDLPDDYFDDDESWPVPATKSAVKPLTAAQRKRLLDEAFTEDLNAELACLVMELEELCEAVYAEFFAVKKEEKTLVEAAAVAKVAIDSAEHVIAKLQIKYPAIRTAQDLINLIEKRIPKRSLDKLKCDVATAWACSREDGGYQYVPGTLLADVLWIGKSLLAWAAQVRPSDPNMSFVLRDGFSGRAYDEDKTPHYTDPDPTMQPHFLLQQLALIYNIHVMNGTTNDKRPLASLFLSHFDRLFSRGVPSIHLVFVCICWIRSVAAIQGNRRLSRTASLSISLRWELERRVRASIAKGVISRGCPPLFKTMQGQLSNMTNGDNVALLIRTNPLFAGFVLLDSQFRLLSLGAEYFMATPRFRDFCHIYNALIDRKLLESIPFFEQVIKVYEPVLFPESRAAAIDGSFYRSYMLSCHIGSGAIDATMDLRAAVPERFKTRARSALFVEDTCRTYTLLTSRDYSVLPTATTSWRSMLRAVSALCHEELFESRVLSWDLLTATDDLHDVFQELCDALGQRATANRQSAPATPRPFAFDHPIEQAVLHPLLPLLGCINRDGTTRVSDDTPFVERLESIRHLGDVVDGPTIMAYCRKAADVISRRFVEPGASEIERAYYTLPHEPRWLSLAFGDPAAVSQSRPEMREKVFADLMEMLSSSDGPLDSDKLKLLKSYVSSDPSLLGMATKDTLCTLYHQAAAGPARDRRLVEWMHQIGALELQPTHCRLRNSPMTLERRGRGDSELCNALAVHCAAERGDWEMVRLILEADWLRDIDTVTYHTRESLAHIAVRHGHQTLFEYLKALDADLTRKDAAGKSVHDVTTNARWKREIVEKAVQQRRQIEVARRANKAKIELFRRENEAAAERLHRELGAQRARERMRHSPAFSKAHPSHSEAGGGGIETLESATVDGETVGATENKKKRRKKEASSGATEMTIEETELTGNLLERMQLESYESDSDSDIDVSGIVILDRVKRIARQLNTIRKNSSASAEERESSLFFVACDLESLPSTMQHYVATNTMLHKTTSIDKDAVEACGAIMLLNKYYHQLPDSAPISRRNTRENLEKIRNLAGDDFAQFLSFVLDTSQVLVACGRTTQAKEILDVVERRLLKMKPRPPQFRAFVQTFMEAREHAQLPTLGEDAARHFEWYMHDHGVSSWEVLGRLDCLHTCKWFTVLDMKDTESPADLETFTTFVNEAVLSGAVSVAVNGCVVVGSQSEEAVADAIKSIQTAVSQNGISLREPAETTKSVKVLGFAFSSDAIARH